MKLAPSKKIVGPDGELYQSRGEACRALGISKTTLYRHLSKHGSLERVKYPYMTPIEYKGKHYRSIASFCRRTGASTTSVHRHLELYGNLDKMRIGKGHLKGSAPNNKPVKLGRFSFSSRANAAEELGCCVDTIINFIKGKGGKKTEALMIKRLENYMIKKLGKDQGVK